MFRVVSSLSISRLKTYLLVSVASQIVSVFGKLNINDLLLQKVIATLTDCVTKIQQYFDYQKTSKYTQILFDADVHRDSLFRSLTETVSGKTWKVDNPELAKAATQIYSVIENYGVTLYKEGYEKESFLLNGLFEDLKKPEMQAALEIINEKDAVEALRASQANFEKLFNDSKESDSLDLPVVADLKKEVLYNINILLTVIDANAYYKIDPFGTIVPQLNTIINDTMARYKSETTRQENNSDNNDKSTAAVVSSK